METLEVDAPVLDFRGRFMGGGGGGGGSLGPKDPPLAPSNE